MHKHYKVPFLKLRLNNSNLRTAIDEVLRNGTLFNGKFTHKFSEAFANYIGIKHFIGCANCTDAIEIILRSQQWPKNSRVAVPAFSWYSDASAVLLAEHQPVFVDSGATSWEMDLQQIKTIASQEDIRALIIPHLFGKAHSEIQEIADFCKNEDILLIEDCAQAHGASLNNKIVGTFGEVGVFSFYPTKNLGALGDAGGIVTDDSEMAEKYQEWANHGQSTRNKHQRLGRNSRFDEMQAAVLYAKLFDLDDINRKRYEFACIYNEVLKEIKEIRLPSLSENQVYHQYCIQLDERKQLINYLEDHGIETDIHYPEPINRLKPFSKQQTQCPRAEKLSKRILSLPIHENHDEEQIRLVASTIADHFI